MTRRLPYRYFKNISEVKIGMDVFRPINGLDYTIIYGKVIKIVGASVQIKITKIEGTEPGYFGWQPSRVGYYNKSGQNMWFYSDLVPVYQLRPQWEV